MHWFCLAGMTVCSVQKFLEYGCLSTWKETMLLRVTVLVFFFLALVRFLRNESIPWVTRRRYGHDTLKLLRNFEKLDYKIRNIELDICFLRKCESKDVVPNFLKFRLANKNLKNSMTQRPLLKAKINSIRALSKSFEK